MVGATEKLHLEPILQATYRVGRNRASWPGGHKCPQKLVAKQAEIRVKPLLGEG